MVDITNSLYPLIFAVLAFFFGFFTLRLILFKKSVFVFLYHLCLLFVFIALFVSGNESGLIRRNLSQELSQKLNEKLGEKMHSVKDKLKEVYPMDESVIRGDIGGSISKFDPLKNIDELKELKDKNVEKLKDLKDKNLEKFKDFKSYIDVQDFVEILSPSKEEVAAVGWIFSVFADFCVLFAMLIGCARAKVIDLLFCKK